MSSTVPVRRRYRTLATPRKCRAGTELQVLDEEKVLELLCMINVSRRFKALLMFIIVTGTLFLANQISQIDNSRMPQADASSSRACLYIEPPLRKDEIIWSLKKNSEHKDDDNIQEVCPGDNAKIKEWHVNVNVPRVFTFRQPLSFWARAESLLFSRSRDGRGGGIPKILHLIWTDEVIPSVFVDNVKLFRNLHPTWKMHFWTINAGRDLIETIEPQLLKTFDRKQFKPIDRADILRYVIMYHIGGAYFDLDSKVLQPLDELTEHHECLIGAEPIENAVFILKMRSLLANSGFMCKPKHAFFRHVIDQIPFYGVLSPGPTFFTKCLNLFLGNQLSSKSNSLVELTVLSHTLFEFDINKGIVLTLEMQCKRYREHIYKYPTECRLPNDNISPECEELYIATKSLGRIGIQFDACLKWISHGEKNRKPDEKTRRFIVHEHYGSNGKTLNYSKENNISLVVPDIVLHM